MGNSIIRQRNPDLLLFLYLCPLAFLNRQRILWLVLYLTLLDPRVFLHFLDTDPSKGIVMQAAGDEIPQLAGNRAMIWKVQVSPLYFSTQLLLTFPAVRHNPVYHLVQRDPQRPYICLFIINVSD